MTARTGAALVVAALAACTGEPAAHEPTVITTATAAIGALAVVEDALYWMVEPGELYRLDRASGDIERVVPTGLPAGWMHDLTVDAASLYVTFIAADGSGLSLRRIDRATGAASTLATGFAPGDIGELVAHDGELYFGSQQRLWHAAAAGPVELARLGGTASGLIAADGSLYAGTGPSEGSSRVVRVPVTGGTIDVLATGMTLPAGLGLLDGALYATDYYSGDLVRIAPGAGKQVLLTDHTPAGLAVSGDRVFYASRFAGESLLRELVDATGGRAVTRYRGARVNGPVADDRDVYFADGPDLLVLER